MSQTAKRACIDATGALLVFGGPYGNLQATEALLEEADRRSIRPTQMLCTGDIAAYCAEPQETVELIRSRSIACVMGNCEEALARDAEDCGCGFEEGTTCDLLSQQWYAFNKKALTAESKSWMGSLPREIEVRIAGRRLLAIHGGVSDISRFIFASSSQAIKHEECLSGGLEGVIAGHSGLPFAQKSAAHLWLNSGALGMPANDGTPRVWYALIEAREEGLEISLKALDYDYRKAASRMKEAGLNNGYKETLSSGLWPSLDVLPTEEKKRQGIALEESSLLWPTKSRSMTA